MALTFGQFKMPEGKTMDHSYCIAGHIAARNAAAGHDAQTQDAFYDSFGKDHFAGIKLVLSRMRNSMMAARNEWRLPQATDLRRA